MENEICNECGIETPNLGLSLYDAEGGGPYCKDCHPEYREEVVKKQGMETKPYPGTEKMRWNDIGKIRGAIYRHVPAEQQELILEALQRVQLEVYFVSNERDSLLTLINGMTKLIETFIEKDK